EAAQQGRVVGGGVGGCPAHENDVGVAVVVEVGQLDVETIELANVVGGNGLAGTELGVAETPVDVERVVVEVEGDQVSLAVCVEIGSADPHVADGGYGHTGGKGAVAHAQGNLDGRLVARDDQVQLVACA